MPFTTRVPAIALVIACVSCGGSDAPPAGEAEDAPSASARAATRTGGTMEGVLGGEQHSWNVLVNDAASGSGSSSTWRTRAMGSRSILMLSLNAYPGTRPAIAGSISITAATTAEPGTCPCDVMLQSIEYWEGTAAMYRAEGARVTLDRLEPVDGGTTYRAEGTFSGTLVPDGTFEGAEAPRPIEGSFTIDHVAPAVAAR